MGDLVGSPDIILVWPKGAALAAIRPVSGYTVAALPASRDRWWIDIHRRAVPSFDVPRLEEWLCRYRELALDEGILVATCDATGTPVATAGSIANTKGGMMPDGGQLAWVATDPAHRGRGLATWLSAVATRRLLDDGFRTLFLCTGDDLGPAIRVYLRLGYVPCLYASDQAGRWERLMSSFDEPLDRTHWVDLASYLATP